MNKVTDSKKNQQIKQVCMCECVRNQSVFLTEQYINYKFIVLLDGQ